MDSLVVRYSAFEDQQFGAVTHAEAEGWCYPARNNKSGWVQGLLYPRQAKMEQRPSMSLGVAESLAAVSLSRPWCELH